MKRMVGHDMDMIERLWQEGNRGVQFLNRRKHSVATSFENHREASYVEDGASVVRLACTKFARSVFMELLDEYRNEAREILFKMLLLYVDYYGQFANVPVQEQAKFNMEIPESPVNSYAVGGES